MKRIDAELLQQAEDAAAKGLHGKTPEEWAESENIDYDALIDYARDFATVAESAIAGGDNVNEAIRSTFCSGFHIATEALRIAHAEESD